MPLFLAFLAVPLIEIALFVTVGAWIGLWATLAIVVLTAVIGTMLMRSQGLAAIARLKRALEAGEDPVGPLAHGVLILVAGLLLVTPGFFTDTLGFCLMVPGIRAALLRAAGPWLAARVVRWGPGAAPGSGGDVIDADYEVVDERRPGRTDPPSGWVRQPPDGQG
ncbi:MAG TPA: FxsA family protein [Paracoccaceae bacterium]|nr:FxsA family protein [Paracoccaceae bacterium]